MLNDKTPLELSEDYQYALNRLEKTPTSMFITGKAGTGKSTLLQLFRNTTNKKVVVLAPTGVAALNVRGQTLHSFFGFPPKPLSRSEIKKRRFRKLYKNMEVLVIDEISMVRADMVDNIDYFLRINRENPMPFGGAQVVFFGDLFQLPPVIASDEERMLIDFNYDSPYFFSAHVFKNFELEKMELRKVYRQEERQFIRLLDAVRLNRVDYDDIADLNERHIPDFKKHDDNYITLSTRNAIVNSINTRELSNIPLEEYGYMAEIRGDFNARLFPTDALLKLKLGAQVMFIKNDPSRKYVNGTIGKVTFLDIDKIVVEVKEDGGTVSVDVEQEEWEIVKYNMSEKDGKIEAVPIGTFKQYPLRPAWAITIHKSQGKTFDKIILDMGRGAFEHGQTYVALSRCRTLGGLVLKQRIRPSDIMVDERVVEFYEQAF